MENLPLQIRQIDNVKVDESERTHSSGGEIERNWRPEPSRPNDEDARSLERALPRITHLRQDDVTAISNQLFACQFRRGASPFGYRVRGILRCGSVSPSVGR
jgi:hypothetical protein